MRVAIDGRALTGRFTGDRTYWRNLLRALPEVDPASEFVILTRIEVDPAEKIGARNVTYRVIPASNDRIWTVRSLPRELRGLSADLVHVQYTGPPAQFCPCPIVTTVHDISFRLHPSWFPVLHRTLLNLTVPASMRAAARVITVSESSKRDILATYRLPEAKVAAILHGLPGGFADVAGQPPSAELKERAVRFANKRLGIDRPYILAVGVLQPRKNLRMLAEAFGKARAQSGIPHVLVLAGKAGWGTEQEALRQEAERFGGAEAADALLFPGYIEDEDLPEIYRAASAFAYPSLYEGFGLPPLEAMACGVPVLTSDRPALPEVVGNAAITVPATDSDAWARELIRALTDADLRADLAKRGPEHAAGFTWREAAEKTLAVYAEVAAQSARRNKE